MQIQVNTDDNIEGREALAAKVEAEVEQMLGRFREHLTRIEVHLSDENAARTVGPDKRCLMEARPAGMQPVAVTHQAETLAEAYAGAARKMRSLLDTQLGKRLEAKGAASIRDNPLR